MHWDEADRPLIEFTVGTGAAPPRAPDVPAQAVLHRHGRALRRAKLDDIVWLHPDGRTMENGDWDAGGKSLGMYLNGHGIAGRDDRGDAIVDDHFLLFFNAGDTLELTLPPAEYAEKWDVIVDTGGVADDARTYVAGDTFELQYRSLVVLREHRAPESEPDHSVAASLARPEQRPGGTQGGAARDPWARVRRPA